MTTPHLPDDVRLHSLGVVPLDVDLGVVAGHRVLLLSLERWDGWADLRFARIDEQQVHRLTRRVPPADAWHVVVDGSPVRVHDAVGRGDRTFSNGEVRLSPWPADARHLDVTVEVAPGHGPLHASFDLA
ncbi:MAG: hypothetical protein WDZ26_00460, partial [Nitriliruptoraceae bacterium]